MAYKFLAWASAPSGITCGDLLEAFGVGVGLYLALAIIQAVAGFRFAILRRRLDTLRRAITSRKMAGEYQNIRSINGNLSNLEIQFESFFDIVFKMVVVAFAIGLLIFHVALVNQSSVMFNLTVWVSIFYFLWLPFFIFLGSASVISRKSAAVEQSMLRLSQRVQARLIEGP